MAKRYWIQYHSYEAMQGPPKPGVICTDLASSQSPLQLGKDVIFILVSIRPRETPLIDCGLPPSVLPEIENQTQCFFLWSKFVPKSWDQVAEKRYGGFNHEIRARSNSCTLFQKSPILLQSQEFKFFWHKVGLGPHFGHGLIRLSQKPACPFPELENVGEDFVYQNDMYRVGQHRLRIPKKVKVPNYVDVAIKFMRNHVHQRHELLLTAHIVSALNRHGYSSAACWIHTHQPEYLGAIKFGYQVKPQ